MPSEDPHLLSADDAHILGMESAVITGHTLKLVVLEPGAQPLDVDALRASVAARLAAEPRATQLVDTSGGAPRWVDASGFDIEYHVRHSGVKCASRADLWRAVSTLMAMHLDRGRPLWTFDVIGPLADGGEAIAVRIHHAMVDGIAGIRFLNAVLWDPHPDPPPGTGLRASTAAHGWVEEALRMPGTVVRELGHRGSASPFDRPITGLRELAFTAARLADLKAIGSSRPAHATVNDVLLTIVAGGLRRWLGAAATPRLRAQIPVSLHHRDEAADELGNRDSFINVDLRLDIDDPLARLDQISAETRRCKQAGDAKELYDLFHALGRVTNLGAAVRRLANSSREFSVAISNVPGPAGPVAVAGRRVAQLFSSSEPALHHALRIAAISCSGGIGIGMCTDPRALPNVAQLADDIETSYRELTSTATRVDAHGNR